MVIINIIQKIKLLYYKWQYKEYNDDIYEFIWGIKSYDDLSNNEAGLWTMNDIDIVYNKKTKKYLLSIETIYIFENGREGEMEYVKYLFNMLTKWMISQGYDVNKEISFYNIFTEGVNINTEFDSIEDLYATFKFLVNGFVK